MSIAEKIALLAFISQTPVLQSCLYELNLMPEQLKRGSKQWDSMLTLAFHFREGLQQQSQKITELEREINDMRGRTLWPRTINQG